MTKSLWILARAMLQKHVLKASFTAFYNDYGLLLNVKNIDGGTPTVNTELD